MKKLISVLLLLSLCLSLSACGLVRSAGRIAENIQDLLGREAESTPAPVQTSETTVSLQSEEPAEDEPEETGPTEEELAEQEVLAERAAVQSRVETVSITADNWEQYFELQECNIFYLTDGQYSAVRAGFVIALRPEYAQRLISYEDFRLVSVPLDALVADKLAGRSFSERAVRFDALMQVQFTVHYYVGMEYISEIDGETGSFSDSDRSADIYSEFTLTGGPWDYRPAGPYNDYTEPVFGPDGDVFEYAGLVCLPVFSTEYAEDSGAPMDCLYPEIFDAGGTMLLYR